MPINFYYDRITKEGPVPNGIGEYFIDKRKWPFPLGKSRFEPGSEQPIVKIISSFYYTMLQNDCNIELFTDGNICLNLFYPLEVDVRGINLNISGETLEYLQRGELKLLLLGLEFQGRQELLYVKDLADKFLSIGISYNNIFIVTSDLNNSYKKLLKPYKTYSLDWWQIESRLIICDKICKRKYTNFGYNYFLGAPILPIKQFDLDKFKPKKLFYSVTKNTSIHRLSLISELIANNLDNEGIINYHPVDFEINYKDPNLLDLYRDDEYVEKKKKIISILQEEGINFNLKDDISYHKDSLFTIVTPRFAAHKNDQYMDEINSLFTNFEIWQLIAMGKPFIILGSCQLIKYLNREGYFTFYDIINEEYDTFLDFPKRAKLICDELIRIRDSCDTEKKLEQVKEFTKVNREKYLGITHQVKFLKLFDEMRYGRKY